MKILLLSILLLLSQQSFSCEFTIYRGIFYKISEGKAYKMENVNGFWMTTNEWFPLTKDGYVEY